MPPYFVFEQSWVCTVMPIFLATSNAVLPPTAPHAVYGRSIRSSSLSTWHGRPSCRLAHTGFPYQMWTHSEGRDVSRSRCFQYRAPAMQVRACSSAPASMKYVAARQYPWASMNPDRMHSLTRSSSLRPRFAARKRVGALSISCSCVNRTPLVCSSDSLRACEDTMSWARVNPVRGHPHELFLFIAHLESSEVTRVELRLQFVHLLKEGEHLISLKHG